MATTKKNTGSLCCPRIELEGVTPLIWRNFWVEGDATLIQLHHTIQAVMRWTDSHLHEYQSGGARYRTPHPDDDIDGDDAIDDRTVPLHKVLKGISHFGYRYDFGDAWNHTITVEKTEPMPEHPRGCAFIEEGERACPPEDAGGPFQYQEFPRSACQESTAQGGSRFPSLGGRGLRPQRV